MNRQDLQQLADSRIRDAEALFQAGQWSGAYYLAGYAVECGLKACIAKTVMQHDYPNKELALKCYTHNIEVLVKAAGLDLQRANDAIVNGNFGTNWLIVKDWDEKSRYQHWSEAQARTLVFAINESTNGVLSWIKFHW